MAKTEITGNVSVLLTGEWNRVILEDQEVQEEGMKVVWQDIVLAAGDT